jgi:hypothetical protein
LPAGSRSCPRPCAETDKILLVAAAAGASLEDLATIAAAIEQWRSQPPDPDEDPCRLSPPTRCVPFAPVFPGMTPGDFRRDG